MVDCTQIEVTSVIDTTNRIYVIAEYEPTINYPDVIFVPSPKTSADFCWGTNYDNDLIINNVSGDLTA